ncbi:MAG: DUF3068 domain-containing protein [Dehalococcoidia bacterium]|nr:DUF3068 domain-containing protein [Dehalococcoidia bacterium]
MATQRKGLRGYRLIILAVLGAILAVFGALWVSVIFPALDRMPGDYERAYYFDGTASQMNPATMSMDTIPVKQTLTQEAIGTENGALLIHEVRTMINTETGEDVSAIYGDETVLAIDARTLEYKPQVDERARWGQFGPPRPLAVGQSFDMWHPGAGQALPATYMAEDTFRGLNVYIYAIDETNIPIGKEPTSGMNLFLSPQITLWIEPSSGTVVNQTSTTTTSIDFMGTMLPVQISVINYAEETTVELMDVARSANWLLLWFRTLVPWIAIGLGCVFVSFAAVTVAVRNLRKARAKVPTERPTPTSLPLDV